jgi:hypothetical protein
MTARHFRLLVAGSASLLVAIHAAHAQDARPTVPGAIRTTNLDEICSWGYSRRTRPLESVTEPYKLTLIANLPPFADHDPTHYELDDKVPICLGGQPGPANWWLQPREQANAKDDEDWRACRAVCEHRASLLELQHYFLNWPAQRQP